MPEVCRRAQRATPAHERRAAHWKQFLGAQPGDVQAGPISVAVTNRQIDILARKIDVLQRAETRRSMAGCCSANRPSRCTSHLLAKLGDVLTVSVTGIVPLQQIFGSQRQPIEGVAHDHEIGLPGRRDDEAAVLAVEQPAAKFGFQRLDLVADGALRHAQLLRRLGEALVPRRGLESLQSVERWQSARHGQPYT